MIDLGTFGGYNNVVDWVGATAHNPSWYNSQEFDNTMDDCDRSNLVCLASRGIILFQIVCCVKDAKVTLISGGKELKVLSDFIRSETKIYRSNMSEGLVFPGAKSPCHFLELPSATQSVIMKARINSVYIQVDTDEEFRIIERLANTGKK